VPYRLNEFRAKIQFMCSSRMPSQIHQAVLKTGEFSNTTYIQRAVCERLARDLDLPLSVLLDDQPEPQGRSRVLFGADRRPVRRVKQVAEVE
jgi:hypothetical protein